MRLTLVIYSMSAGGAERVMSILANAWAERGWEVTLLTFTGEDKPSFYPLHPGVTFRGLGIDWPSPDLHQKVLNPLRRILGLRAGIKSTRPDVVISFTNVVNILTTLAAVGLKLPTVVCEHTYPARMITPGWAKIREWVYPRATRVVTLNQVSFDYFPESIRRVGFVVPNPVCVPPAADDIEEPSEEKAEKTLIAMGRLVESKGFDLLLEAFARIAPRYPDWKVHIFGEGPIRSALEAQRDRLGLESQVRLPGITTESYLEMKRSDIFVLSSRFEGFPMALCEALASGLPVVSFDCTSGPREIIREGVDGVIVPAEDVEALARALDKLMSDGEQRRKMAARGPEIRERFSLEAVLGIWDQLFRDLGMRPDSVRSK